MGYDNNRRRLERAVAEAEKSPSPMLRDMAAFALAKAVKGGVIPLAYANELVIGKPQIAADLTSCLKDTPETKPALALVSLFGWDGRDDVVGEVVGEILRGADNGGF